MDNFIIISISLLIDGIFVSGIFAFESLDQITNQQSVITQLYTADLAGGGLGSLIASLVLVPFYGFYISLIVLIALCVCCSIYSRL
jgi:hypothetical protein